MCRACLWLCECVCVLFVIYWVMMYALCDVLCDGVWCVIVCFGVSVWVFRLFCLCLVSADVCLMVCDLSLFVMYCVVLSGLVCLCVFMCCVVVCCL